MASLTREVTYEYRKQNPTNREVLRKKLMQTVNRIPQAERETKFAHPNTVDSMPPESFRTSLGKYLWYAAKVYDAMDIEHDVLLLKDYLHGNPPLHGRRTLDQSYYWKLDDTGPRDRDQVVYRGTKTGKDTRGTARVIMVDQLWLYILDDREFPMSLSFRIPALTTQKPLSPAFHDGGAAINLTTLVCITPYAHV